MNNSINKEKVHDDFLPSGYETPASQSNYMELEEGQNSFRIVSSAIVGYEWWVENAEGGRKPVRVRTADLIPAAVKNTPDKRNAPRHFWAFAVFNYKTNSLQILELKQITIMESIEALVKNSKWGSPKKYDIIIEKIKTGSQAWDIKYNVIPEPPSKLDAGIVELVSKIPVNLNAIYKGEDPFAVTDDVDPDEVDRGIKAMNGQRASS
jgi:hypothetical protein